MTDDPQPTARDLQNAAARDAIARKQNEEYAHILRWALGKFGPGWLPNGRHYPLTHDEEERSRKEGTPAVASATVYTARHEETGDKRHFTVAEDGRVTEVSGYKEAFGPMLQEPDTSRTIEVKGQQVHPHRYSLCWAPSELYHPRSAEALAKTRQTREQNKAAKEEQQWRDSAPLFTTWAERNAAEEDEQHGEGASPPR
jgi:hypothetical protein